jgi:hypothetical protein
MQGNGTDTGGGGVGWDPQNIVALVTGVGGLVGSRQVQKPSATLYI